MARHHSKNPNGLSVLLARLARAAEASRDPGVGEALREFGALALVAIPTCGVFVPNDNDIATAIEQVAKKHLGMEGARRSFREAAKMVEQLEHRDQIESAHTRVQGVSDEAYFYAGLAFGVTLSDFSS